MATVRLLAALLMTGTPLGAAAQQFAGRPPHHTPQYPHPGDWGGGDRRDSGHRHHGHHHHPQPHAHQHCHHHPPGAGGLGGCADFGGRPLPCDELRRARELNAGALADPANAALPYRAVRLAEGESAIKSQSSSKRAGKQL
jgi:hypothetical protein